MALKIKALATTKGFLENARVELADGLTCIIGARGTCKSTVVETLRFAFDCDRRRVNLLLGKREEGGPENPAAFGLVKATLATGTASVAVIDEGGPLVIERTVDGDPKLHRERHRDAPASVLDRIEIYSQGDLQRIAEDGGRRLDLIDRPNRARIGELLARRKAAAAELRDVGLRLRQARTQIEGKRNELKVLPALAAELRNLQDQRPQLGAKLEAERQGFLQRKAILEKVQALAAKRTELLEGLLLEFTENEGEFRAAAEQLAGVAGTKTIAEAFRGLADLLETSKRSVQAQHKVDLGPALDKLRINFDDQNQGYYKLEKEASAIQDSLRAEDRLRQQIAQLQRHEPELKKLEEQEKELLAARARRRAEVQRIGEEVFKYRDEQVREINERFEGVITLTLTQGTRPADYKATIDRLLSGSRLHKQAELARDLALKVPPSELVDAVEAADAAFLAAHLDRDKGQVTRLIAHLLESPQLYDLESVTYDDQLEIAMISGGVAKPIQELSKGQMATALLPLILRAAEYPLVFDQPEDDLDNRFIYDTLVARIRELKNERQLVFVTHNANIPVLGDADRVIVMQMESPTRAGPPVVGTVDEVKDHVLALLEGGAEAFKERKKRYGKLVK